MITTAETWTYTIRLHARVDALRNPEVFETGEFAEHTDAVAAAGLLVGKPFDTRAADLAKEGYEPLTANRHLLVTSIGYAVIHRYDNSGVFDPNWKWVVTDTNQIWGVMPGKGTR